MLGITYWCESGTNWYRVRFDEIGSVILIHKDVLVREVGMNPNCEIGCKEVTIDKIIVLGFLPMSMKVERSGT